MATGSEGAEKIPGSRNSKTEPRATEQAASAAHEAVDRAADSAAKAEERIREAAQKSGERLRDKGEEARVTAERTLDHIRQYTRDNPLTAAGLAFAAGLIVSRLMGR